mmetsp:Transcript_15926/g.24011  ORF Transcript_15926/g.24011 Transcript_15926/m.24011 type:complete len:92 (+) Transcript_15926:937-1212(+)
MILGCQNPFAESVLALGEIELDLIAETEFLEEVLERDNVDIVEMGGSGARDDGEGGLSTVEYREFWESMNDWRIFASTRGSSPDTKNLSFL